MLKALTPENAKQMRENIAHLSQDSPEFREFHYAWGSLAGKVAIDNGAETPKRDMAASLAGWAATDPDGAMKYFSSLSENAKKDPAEAVQWASQLPDGDGKNHAISSSFHAWAGRSPEQAAEAISSIPADQRDSARYGYATRVVHDNPAMGVEWAAAISYPQNRNNALVDTGRVYMRKDREEATQWLQNSGLSAEDQARIIGKKK